MWLKRLWNRQRTPSETPSTPQETASLQELARRVQELEARESHMQLAWQETLDKLGRWASKQVARERRRVGRDLDQLGQDGPETHEDAPGDPNGGGPGHHPQGTSDRAAMKAQLRSRAAAILNPRR